MGIYKKEAFKGYDITSIVGTFYNGEVIGFVTDEEDYDPFIIHETKLIILDTTLPPEPECGYVSFHGSLYMKGCRVKFPSEKSVFVDAGGKVHAWGGGSDQAEDNIPVNDARVTFHNVKEISGKAYSVGTLRTVFRRDVPNQWIKLDKGLHGTSKLEKQALSDSAGFNDIDGFSDDNIYACGDGGDLWHFDGNIWVHLDFPVNSDLTVICCADDGYIYIGTNDGRLIKGNKRQWVILNKEQGSEISAIAWFKGSIYFSDGSWVYELINDQTKKVNFGDANPSQFGFLYGGDEVLISAGANNIVSFDGSKWDSLLTPFDLA